MNSTVHLPQETPPGATSAAAQQPGLARVSPVQAPFLPPPNTPADIATAALGSQAPASAGDSANANADAVPVSASASAPTPPQQALRLAHLFRRVPGSAVPLELQRALYAHRGVPL